MFTNSLRKRASIHARARARTLTKPGKLVPEKYSFQTVPCNDCYYINDNEESKKNLFLQKVVNSPDNLKLVHVISQSLTDIEILLDSKKISSIRTSLAYRKFKK